MARIEVIVAILIACSFTLVASGVISQMSQTVPQTVPQTEKCVVSVIKQMTYVNYDACFVVEICGNNDTFKVLFQHDDMHKCNEYMKEREESGL